MLRISGGDRTLISVKQFLETVESVSMLSLSQIRYARDCWIRRRTRLNMDGMKMLSVSKCRGSMIKAWAQTLTSRTDDERLWCCVTLTLKKLTFRDEVGNLIKNFQIRKVFQLSRGVLTAVDAIGFSGPPNIRIRRAAIENRKQPFGFSACSN